MLDVQKNFREGRERCDADNGNRNCDLHFTGSFNRRVGEVDRRKVNTNGTMRRRGGQHGRRVGDQSYTVLPFKAYANAPTPVPYGAFSERASATDAALAKEIAGTLAILSTINEGGVTAARNDLKRALDAVTRRIANREVR